MRALDGDEHLRLFSLATSFEMISAHHLTQDFRTRTESGDSRAPIGGLDARLHDLSLFDYGRIVRFGPGEGGVIAVHMIFTAHRTLVPLHDVMSQ